MKIFFSLFLVLSCCKALAQKDLSRVADTTMQRIYEQIKTPNKYGLVMVPPGDSSMLDCPTVFRQNNTWYMSYIIFDGRGYETWLATSNDLLQWKTLGKMLSFSGSKDWDSDQKAGYMSLVDYNWGGSYGLGKYNGKYWMGYLGGNASGYEAGVLSAGMAYTSRNPAVAHEWKRLPQPVLKPSDAAVRWWENNTIYKNTVIHDRTNSTGFPFVMYYNAKGDSTDPSKATVERIGMAVSKDMVNWQRFGRAPVMDHHRGITGDAYLQQIGNIWVMFYFGAFWKEDVKDGAFDNFACSKDLVNWTDWQGEKLIQPSEPYDAMYAHKPCVVKWKGVVYHFYCAVNNKEQRGIAVATSKPLGVSRLSFTSKK